MKTLTASFFTTVSARQYFFSCAFFWPWNWLKIKRGGEVKILEKKMSELIKTKYCRSFYNARGALYHGLKALGIASGDEVLLQAFTCVSVPNAIMAAGAVPKYVDIELKSLNINPEKIADAITLRTKAIIVTHTFGNPADLAKIGEIAKKHNLFLIEDCAHSLGSKHQGRTVGSFGNFSIFSFGRDKIISSVNGGVLCTNDQGLMEKLPNFLPMLSFWTIIQNLLYAKIGYFSRLTYDFFDLGKIIIFLAKKLALIPKITSSQENACQDQKILNYAMPNSLSYLALRELSRLDKYNARRQELSAYFKQNLDSKLNLIYPESNQGDKNVFLRLGMFAGDRKKLYDFCRARKIILGNWYDAVIAPKNASSQNACYIYGSCPNAEKVSQKIVNIPNHYSLTQKDAARIVKTLNAYAAEN